MDVLRDNDGKIRKCTINMAVMSVCQNQKNFHPYPEYWKNLLGDLNPIEAPALTFFLALPFLPLLFTLGPWFAAWYNRKKAIEEVIVHSMLEAINREKER